MKDRLWSIDLFRCESATLRSHWVLVVMDQYTRRIIGFGVHAGKVDGVGLCRMFNRAIRGQLWMPKYLSSDNDPLCRFHRWQANLRVLEVTEIKSIPYVPLSHPFVERLIGTFVVHNKCHFVAIPVMWRSFRKRSRWNCLHGLERHITDGGSETPKEGHESLVFGPALRC